MIIFILLILLILPGCKQEIVTDTNINCDKAQKIVVYSCRYLEDYDSRLCRKARTDFKLCLEKLETINGI